MKKILTIFIVMVMCFAAFAPCAAFATPPTYYGEGNVSFGLVPSQETDVELEKLQLNYDIVDLPNADSSNTQSKVAATYKLHNPTDAAVNVTLRMPTRCVPEYMRNADFDYANCFADSDIYSITVDGINKAPIWRVTSSGYYYNEDDVLSQMSQLKDAPTEDDIGNPTVYKYTYNVTFAGAEVSEKNRYVVKFLADHNKINVRLDGEWYGFSNDNIELYVSSGSEIVLLSVGETFDLPACAQFSEVKYNTETYEYDFIEANGNLSLQKEEQLSFDDVIYTHCPSNFNKIDWRNAVTTALANNMSLSCILSGEIQQYMYRWLEFDVQLQPKSSVNVSVTMPVYPNIDGGYTPSVYTYCFETFPDVWKGEFVAEINQHNYYITKNYGLSNDGKYQFEVCSEENPQTNDGFGAVLLILFLLFWPLMIVSLPFALLKYIWVFWLIVFVVKGVCAIILGIWDYKRRKRKEAATESSTSTVSQIDDN